MSSAPSMAGEIKDPARIGVLRRIFSFPVMLCGMLTALSMLTVRGRLNDPDMWWNLKTGEVIYKTHTIPTTDLFSYTTNHCSLVPHEWLAQVLIYAAYHWGGYSGLMLWLFIFTSLVVIAGYVLCALYSGNAKTALVGALVVWFFSTSGDAIRPQLIGCLCLTLELLLIHLGSTRSPRWFLWLPPLFAVWVNCHGTFFFGIFLLALFLFCSFFEFRMGSLVASRWDVRRRRMLALALLISAAALFVNPVGLDQVLYPVRFLVHLPLNLNLTEEWKPLQFTALRGMGLLVVLGLVFLIEVIRRSDLYWHELLLIAIGTEMALNHRRMLFVFGILAAPVLARLIADLWDRYDARRDMPAANAVMLAIAAAIVVAAFPKRAFLVEQVSQTSPVKAVEFIKTHRLPGNMLNSYGDGGYLIWTLSEHPVFIDGRGDVFELAGVFGEFVQWMTLQSDPNLLLNKYNIGFCLLEQQSPMTPVLKLLPGWKLIYSDGQSVIFERSALIRP